MRISQTGINLIKHFEGLHDGDLKQIGLQPKKCPAGIWTEGFGHAMRDADGNFLKGDKAPNSTLTIAEAEALLDKDLDVFELIVERRLKIKVSQQAFDMLVSHTYNTGGSSTLFRMFNDKASIESIISWNNNHYIRGGGQILNGLIARRKAESKLLLANI